MNFRKMNKAQRVTFTMYILMGVLGGLVILWYLKQGITMGKGAAELSLTAIGLFVCLYASFFVNIILHEFGHMIFGLLTGYKFSSFRILNIVLLKKEDKLSVKKYSIPGTAGQCLMSPPEINDGKMPVVMYNLGGILMNFIVGVIFLVMSFVPEVVIPVRAMFMMFAVTGIIIALTNGIPMDVNDGANTLALMHDKQAVKAFWLQLKISEEQQNGIRLRDMPSEWFYLPTDDSMNNSMVSVIGVFYCNRLFDELKFDETEKVISHLLSIDSKIPDIYRKLLICDKIYIELTSNNRKAYVEHMLDEEQMFFIKSAMSFLSVIRTVYAYNLIGENDLKSAEEDKRLFEKVAASYPYEICVESERELIKIAEEKYERTTN